jgi:dihydropyrimidinase
MAASGAEALDANKLVILPGAIDAHRHLGHGCDIARPHVSGDAAALGSPPSALLLATVPFEEEFAELRAITEAGARIEFGYHSTATCLRNRTPAPRRQSL